MLFVKLEFTIANKMGLDSEGEDHNKDKVR